MPACPVDIEAVAARDLRVVDVGRRRSVYGYLLRGQLGYPGAVARQPQCRSERHGAYVNLVDCLVPAFTRLGLRNVEPQPAEVLRDDADNDLVFRGDERTLSPFLCTGDDSLTCCPLPDGDVGAVAVATGIVMGPVNGWPPWTMQLETVCTIPSDRTEWPEGWSPPLEPSSPPLRWIRPPPVDLACEFDEHPPDLMPFLAPGAPLPKR